MFEKVIPKDARTSLAILGKKGLLKNAYLAGGTAVALHIGHRYSYDFDFFTAQEFDEEILIQQIAGAIPDFRLDRKSRGTILGYLGDIRFSVFYYKYPLLFQTHRLLGINVADVRDIVPMKISAIADRGTKRDFIDLYFLLAKEKIMTLKEAFDLYDKKFGALSQNKIHLLKSIVYFEDAEDDKMPQMIKPVRWHAVREFFIREQRKIVKELLSEK